MPSIRSAFRIQPIITLAKTPILDVWVGQKQSSKRCSVKKVFLTLIDPCISESYIEIKIKFKFYFHTSLWCLKRFYEVLQGLHKTFRGTTMKCENKINLIFSLRPGLGREALKISQNSQEVIKKSLWHRCFLWILRNF